MPFDRFYHADDTNNKHGDKFRCGYDKHDADYHRHDDDDIHVDDAYDEDHIHHRYYVHDNHRDVDYDYAYDNHASKHIHHALCACCIDNNQRDIYNYYYVDHDANDVDRMHCTFYAHESRQ